MSTRLFTMPPSRARSFGTHLSTSESIRTKNVRAENVTAETVVTDSLQDRNGNSVLNNDYLLLSEAAAYDAPQAGFGRLWVRNDVPSKLVFTNDAGTDTPITPGLADVLAIDNDAATLSIVNVSEVNFSGGVRLGTLINGTSTVDDTCVAIGQNSTALAPYSTSIGNDVVANNNSAVVIGTDCAIVSVAPNANAAGGVAVGYKVYSYGQGICMGNNITNHSLDQDNENANIMIGSNITHAGALGGIVAIGDSITPNNLSLFIGSSTASLGGTAGKQVCIGDSAQVGTSGSISIGRDAYAANAGNLTGAIGPCIAIGWAAESSAEGSIGIGRSVVSSGLSSIAQGNYAQATGSEAIAIGSNCNSTAAGSIAMGNYALAAHADTVVLGNAVESRMANEFVIQGMRIVTAELTTFGTGTAQTILEYPTLTLDTLQIDATIIGMKDDGTVSYLGTFENYHFRNKAGVLSQSAGIGTQSQDSTDVAYSSSIGVNGTNIRLRVTDTIAHVVNWRCVLRLYGTPDI